MLFEKNANIGSSFGESPIKATASRCTSRSTPYSWANSRRVIASLSQSPNQPLTWIELIFAAAPAAANSPGCHAPLAPIPEPAVDMDRADLRGGASGVHQRDNPVRVFGRQRPGILGVIDGQVGDPVGLIGGDPRAGNGGEYLLAEPVEPLARGGALFFRQPEAARHRPALAVVAEPERAVLANNRVHRPEPGNQIAPPGGTPGHRDHPQPALRQPFQCVIRAGREVAVGGQGVVDVKQHELDRAPHRDRPVAEPQDTGRSLGSGCHRAFPVPPHVAAPTARSYLRSAVTRPASDLTGRRVVHATHDGNRRRIPVYNDCGSGSGAGRIWRARA